MKHTMLCLLVLWVLAPSVSVQATPVPWGDEGHWYEAVYDSSGIAWDEAKTEAENAGGYLATVGSEEENAFLYSLVSDPQYWYMAPPPYEYSLGPWLGGYQFDKDAEPEGHWRWQTDESWDYTYWAVGEPNNLAGNEDWLHFYTNYNMGELTPGPTWNDASITSPERGFLIEWNSDPSPTERSSWGRIKSSYRR